MKIAIQATTRSVQGTGASRRLRHADKVPGILYGAGKEATLIELLHNDIFHKLRNEAFHASILDLHIDGKSERALLRDVQMHPFKNRVLHLDFQRVDEGKKMHMKVPLHFINADKAPGVKLSGGIVSHVLNELDITCLPKDLPEFIEIDLTTLASGHSIHVSNVKMPQGVESAVHRGEDLVIATIIIPRGALTEAEGAPVVAAADVPASNQKVKEEEKKEDKAKKK